MDSRLREIRAWRAGYQTAQGDALAQQAQVMIGIVDDLLKMIDGPGPVWVRCATLINCRGYSVQCRLVEGHEGAHV